MCMIAPLSPATAASSIQNNDPLFALIHCWDTTKTNLNIASCHSMQNAARASFDWSDFPVVREYSAEHCIASAENMHSKSPSKRANTLSQSSSCPSQPAVPTGTQSRKNSTHGDLDITPQSPSATISAMETTCWRDNSAGCNRKTVSFSPVLEIRTHEIILGDHPCCRRGLPLSLGWDHKKTQLVNMESFHQSGRTPIRWDYQERVNLLEHITGLSEQELIEQQVNNELQQASRASIESRGPSLRRGWRSTRILSELV